MANSLFHQTSWDVHQKEAWEGQLGNQPAPIIIPGVLNVPSGTVKPRPGYPVFYNTDNDAWEYPTTADNILRISAAILYEKSDIVDDDNIVEYDDGAVLELLIRGTVWGRARAALKPTQRLTWTHHATDVSMRGWTLATDPSVGSGLADEDAVAAATTAALKALGATRLSSISPRAAEANGLIEIYLNGGGIY